MLKERRKGGKKKRTYSFNPFQHLTDTLLSPQKKDLENVAEAKVVPIAPPVDDDSELFANVDPTSLYKGLKKIGEGSSGSVYTGTKVDDGRKVN